MVNDLYTRLVNLPASNSLELIDPSFSPFVLSEKQMDIRNQIFPTGCSKEYMNFIAKGVVRICQSSSIWDLFLENEKRQPVFLTDITAQDLIPSLSITVNKNFIRPAGIYPDTTPVPQKTQNVNNNFLVTQEYIYSPGGTCTIGVYGVYSGRPESGVFNSSWIISYTGGSTVEVSSQASPNEKISVPIIYFDDGQLITVSSIFPTEPDLSFRIFGVTIPSGFSCVVNAKRPMSYSYQDMYSRLATCKSINEILSLKDKNLSQIIDSNFWSNKNLQDSIASVMLGYVYSFDA
jgi:hypothetical protein